MLGHLRPYVGQLKKLIAWPYLKANFTPNQVGLFGVFLAFLAALTFRLGFQQTSFWLALVAVLTDMADGEVARARGLETPEGNYLDAIGDRLREGFLLIGLVPVAPNLVCIALLGTFLTSFAKARLALVIISDNRDWAGFGDHADRAVILLFAYFFAPVSYWPIALMVLVTLSCFVTRVRTAVRLVQEANDERLLPYLRSPQTDASDKSRLSDQ